MKIVMKRLAILFLSAAISMNTFPQKLEIGLTTGTTGVGFDVSHKINELIGVRGGFSFMPHFEVPMHFDITTGKMETDPSTGLPYYHQTDQFNRLSQFFKDYTGYEVEPRVVMNGHATYYNFKFLVDFHPFNNKKWHLTTGFYIGNSTIGKAENAAESATALVGLGMYNGMYDKAINMNLPRIVYNADIAKMFNNDLRLMMIYCRDNRGDNYRPIPWGSIDGTSSYSTDMSDEDIDTYSTLYSTAHQFGQMKDYGRMGVYIGDYTITKIQSEDNGHPAYDENGILIGYYELDNYGNEIREGCPYVMVPNEAGRALAKAKANVFKPYIGFGYGSSISKDKRLSLSFDAGVLFWGGSPSVITHDGTDIIHDITNVQGTIGDYVKKAKALKVFPVLEARLSYTIK